jgi:Kef-type K+ transport system membrane component KefB
LSVIIQRITTGPTLAYAVLILTLIVAPRLAELVRLPAMVGLVLAGMALGPHGAGLLAGKHINLASIGDFGLLYLMFSAGLELDLKLFLKMRRAAITFALLSFAIPFTLGVVSARMLHYHWAAAVLMGSNWGSHTLVTYTLLRQMGLARNRAVATVVGATAVTDTSALLVLSVVSGLVKPAGSLGLQLVEIVLGLAALVVWSLVALPHVARWFFGRVGTDRSYRFVFGLAAFLIGAVLAEAAGIDGIVGAFFAGLGLNRAVPEDSPLMDRLQFTGSTLFIPIFLVSVGVLLQPKVMIDPRTLGVAFVFTVAVLGGKALAAVVAGRAFRFTWPEVGVMSGLSGSQAAATLATTLVGAKLGLFNQQTINAVLVVILVSLVVTPAMVTFFGKRVSAPAEQAAVLGKAVLVPIWGASSRPVLSLAGDLAAHDGGIVLAASFAGETASASEVATLRKLTSDAEGWLAKKGLESKCLFRVARTVPEGLLQTAVAESATLLAAEWHVSEILDASSEAARILNRATIPALIAQGDIAEFQRLVVILDGQTSPRDVSLVAQIAGLAGRGRPIVAVSVSPAAVRSSFPAKPVIEWIAAADPLSWASENLQSTDLPLFGGMERAREAVRRLRSLDAGRLLVAAAPPVATPPRSSEPATEAPPLGRSLKPRPA